MVTEPQFQLTTKDHAVLQAILERYRGPRGPYLLLLERKLRDSAICFRDDIPPGVVTLNTRLTYSVDGVPTGPHVIVQSQADDLPSYAVSIHTLRGLALLGLSERHSITVDVGDGSGMRVTVEDVLSQPEAEAKAKGVAAGIVQGDSAGRTGNVLGFARRLSRAEPGGRFSSDDDDPGPRAA